MATTPYSGRNRILSTMAFGIGISFVAAHYASSHSESAAVAVAFLGFLGWSIVIALLLRLPTHVSRAIVLVVWAVFNALFTLNFMLIGGVLLFFWREWIDRPSSTVGSLGVFALVSALCAVVGWRVWWRFLRTGATPEWLRKAWGQAPEANDQAV